MWIHVFFVVVFLNFKTLHFWDWDAVIFFATYIMIKHNSSYCVHWFCVPNYFETLEILFILFPSALFVHIISGSMGIIVAETQNHFLVCPSRRTPMTAEERLLYLSQSLFSSSVSPSLLLSPDDGQLCCFTQSHTKEIRKHKKSKDCVWTLDTASGFFKKCI